MQPITSQRGRKRAEQEAGTVRKQIAEVQRKRDESNKAFDGMRDMLSEQLHEIENAIRDYDAGPPQLSLAKESA